MKKIVMGLASLFLMTSCATIVNGSKQKIDIHSSSRETIRVYDIYGTEIASGNGQLSLNLPRATKGLLLGAQMGAEYTVKTSKETKVLVPSLNAAYVYGNPFTLGIGWVVDNATGSGYTLMYNGSAADTLNFK